MPTQLGIQERGAEKHLVPIRREFPYKYDPQGRTGQGVQSKYWTIDTVVHVHGSISQNAPWLHLKSSDQSPNSFAKRCATEMTKKDQKPADFFHPVSKSLLASSRSSRFSSEDNKLNNARLRRHETTAGPKGDKSRQHPCRHKTFKSSFSSYMSLYSLISSSQKHSLVSVLRHKALEAKSAESKQPALRSVMRHYALAVEYRPYRMANLLQRYDDLVST